MEGLNIIGAIYADEKLLIYKHCRAEMDNE